MLNKYVGKQFKMDEFNTIIRDMLNDVTCPNFAIKMVCDDCGMCDYFLRLRWKPCNCNIIDDMYRSLMDWDVSGSYVFTCKMSPYPFKSWDGKILCPMLIVNVTLDKIDQIKSMMENGFEITFYNQRFEMLTNEYNVQNVDDIINVLKNDDIVDIDVYDKYVYVTVKNGVSANTHVDQLFKMSWGETETFKFQRFDGVYHINGFAFDKIIYHDGDMNCFGDCLIPKYNKYDHCIFKIMAVNGDKITLMVINDYIPDENVSRETYEIDESCDFECFHSLDYFINEYKKWYDTAREIKMGVGMCGTTFDEIFHEFISVYLYTWGIPRDETVALFKYDDYCVVYTKNNRYVWGWE